MLKHELLEPGAILRRSAFVDLANFKLIEAKVHDKLEKQCRSVFTDIECLNVELVELV